MPEDETTGELGRDDLVAIFTRWNSQAQEGRWPPTRDAEASADHFLTLAREHRNQETQIG